MKAPEEKHFWVKLIHYPYLLSVIIPWIRFWLRQNATSFALEVISSSIMSQFQESFKKTFSNKTHANVAAFFVLITVLIMWEYSVSGCHILRLTSNAKLCL